jgi:regulator of RNase E activity RraA
VRDRLSGEHLLALARYDTCTVANAIETFGVRLRNEGFSGRGIRSFTPQLPAVVGFAETIRVRSSSPPWQRKAYFDRTDWWTALQVVPSPRILVLQDIDPEVGLGAFVGGVHAHILRALGCVAAVTNGAVRDIPELLAAGLPVFAGNLSPSHAYVHVVDYGQPVEVAGLRIAPGDLLHADQHGIVSIPLEVATRIPAVADRIVRREERIFEFCRGKTFSVEGLRSLLDDEP